MSDSAVEECKSCKSIAGIARVSPGPFIYEGRYWMVDHAYPTALAGWLVIVLKRHAEALHELSHDEFAELGELQYKTVQALHSYFNPAKEYMMLYAEAQGFRHLHVHMVPRAADIPADLKGPASMQYLNPARPDILPAETIRKVSEDMSRYYL